MKKYRARSAYKLLKIDKRYNLIKDNYKVLDLGCWPGGWLQVAKEKTNNLVLGVDVKKIKKLENIKFIKADVFDEDIINKIKKFSNKFDVVLSDISAKTTGIKEIDHANSINLNERVLFIAKKVLKKDGNFLCKVFQGKDFNKFKDKVSRNFNFVKSYKPETSRKRSKEIYIIAKCYND